MASSSPMNCCICNESFNEDKRCPRNLPCGHHMCTECIDKLITGDTKSCPVCRKEFKASSAKDVMVNYGMLECIKIMSSSLTLSSRSSSRASLAFQNKILEFKTEASRTTTEVMDDLEELKKDTECLLNSTEEVLESLALESTDFNDLAARIKEVHNKISTNQEKLQTTSVKLKNRMKDIEKKEKVMSSARNLLESASSLEDTTAVIDEVEKTNGAFIEWADSLKQSLLGEEAKIHEARKELLTSKQIKEDINEALMCRPEVGFHAVPITSLSVQRTCHSTQINALGLWEMNPLLKRLVERGKLYALQNIGNKRKSGKITLEKGKLHLYSLEDEPSPLPNVYYLEYDGVRRLAKAPFKLFLDLCANGEALGRIIICMKDNQSLDFLPLHFIGTNGNSYVNTSLQVTNRGQLWERAIFGRPMAEAENGNWTGFNIDVANVSPSDCRYLTILNGSPVPPIIAFNTGPLAYNRGTVIGEVTEGLKIVRDALRDNPDVKEITVSHCGMLLSTENDIVES